MQSGKTLDHIVCRDKSRIKKINHAFYQTELDVFASGPGHTQLHLNTWSRNDFLCSCYKHTVQQSLRVLLHPTQTYNSFRNSFDGRLLH